jgi:hypothetical protein
VLFWRLATTFFQAYWKNSDGASFTNKTETLSTSLSSSLLPLLALIFVQTDIISKETQDYISGRNERLVEEEA